MRDGLVGMGPSMWRAESYHLVRNKNKRLRNADAKSAEKPGNAGVSSRLMLV